MTPMPKKRKAAIVLGTYALALIAVLGIVSYMSSSRLADYRLATRYSAQEALEETVTAVSHMSGALKKSVYATDAGMRAKICAQVYADALAAEAAMSTLPFATQELEQISGYLNQVGDYAYTLCASAAAEGGFTGDEAENLAKLSSLAASLTDSLSKLQRSYHNGSIEMDSGETRLRVPAPGEHGLRRALRRGGAAGGERGDKEALRRGKARRGGGVCRGEPRADTPRLRL